MYENNHIHMMKSSVDGKSNLTFRVFVCAHRVSCLCHRLLDDADRVRSLRSRIYAFLGDQRGNFASDGRDIVISLLFADLNLAFTEDLWEIRIRREKNSLYVNNQEKSGKKDALLASRTTVFRSSVPKDFLRSLDLATSPFETFMKTLEIWRTSSRSFSLI